jgi:hypothetical protein
MMIDYGIASNYAIFKGLYLLGNSGRGIETDKRKNKLDAPPER